MESFPWARECVIVVMDASRSKGICDALDWALKHVVRPNDTVVVLGVMSDLGKKISCFSNFNMGITIFGIWEKLEFSAAQNEVNPRELGEEIERKKEQYQICLQPFYRQCKRNQVTLEVKLVAGLRPDQITVQEAHKSNTRWIVLDSHLKKYKLFIYGHVGCNLAVMKRKDMASLIPSTSPFINPTPTYSPFQQNPNQNVQNETILVNSPPDPTEESSTQRVHGPDLCWHPLSLREGYPRVFHHNEIEIITNGFTEESIVHEFDDVKIHEGILQDTPVLIKSFSENDERFWSTLTILSRVRHRNIMNVVGYCAEGKSRFMVCDYPCMGTIEMNLQNDEFATDLSWSARWFIGVEIGGCLRYLHEECANGPILHSSVSSINIMFTHGCSAVLGNFTAARLIKDDDFSSEETTTKSMGEEENEDEPLSIDVHDYGIFLIELIHGKSARCFRHENNGKTLVDWAVPLIENESLSQVMDPRVKKIDEIKTVHHMAQAALLCLKNNATHNFTISEVLAVAKGDKLGIAKC